MKLSDLRYFFSQPRPARRYGVDVERIALAGEPAFDYAHWRNPRVERRIFDPGELFALRRFLRPGDFVVDVGAHAGDSAVAYAVVVGTGGCVLALEPNPLAFEVLARNAELMTPVGRIEPRRLAAAENDGRMTFEYSDPDLTNGGLHKNIARIRHGHLVKLEVDVVLLPRLLAQEYADELPRLRFVKIDAEGYDYDIALTMKGLFEQYRPYVQVEIYRHIDAATRHAIYDLFTQLRYRIHWIHGNALMVGDPVRRTEMFSPDRRDVLCVPED